MEFSLEVVRVESSSLAVLGPLRGSTIDWLVERGSLDSDSHVAYSGCKSGDRGVRIARAALADRV